MRSPRQTNCLEFDLGQVEGQNLDPPKSLLFPD